MADADGLERRRGAGGASGDRAGTPAGGALEADCAGALDNPQNCGRCGHDCLGGDCVNGRCQPVKLATATSCVIAVDGGNVYFASGDPTRSTLAAMPTSGGAQTTLAEAAGTISALAVDSTFLYWGEEGSLKKVPVRGGSPTLLADQTPSAIAPHGDNVYFTTTWHATFDPFNQVPTGSVLRVAVDGGSVSALATGLQEVTDIAVDDARVYWAEAFGAGCLWGCILATSLDGGAPSEIVSPAQTGIQATLLPAFALSATDVYWTNQGPVSTVMGRPLEGGAVVTLASEQYEPDPIAVDSSGVYWGTQDSILRVARDGGTAVKLVEDGCVPCAIALDDASVYWIGAGCGSLMRVAK